MNPKPKSNIPAVLTVALAIAVLAIVAYMAVNEGAKFDERTNYQLHH